MAVPIKWNAPSARYNVGLVWNGLQTITKTMKIKAVVDFTPYTATDLTPVAQTIHDRMLLNAVAFPAPPTTMAALATLLTGYEQKLANRSSNASTDVLAFNLARHDLEVSLHDLGTYVNLVAKGDAVIVDKSGFPSYGSAQPGPAGPPTAPQNLKLRNGDLSTTIVARCKPDRPNSFNVAQINSGDPNSEPGWHTVMQFPGGKVTISGLTVGSIVWVRIATVGPGGVLGAWSDPAKIVVT